MKRFRFFLLAPIIIASGIIVLFLSKRSLLLFKKQQIGCRCLNLETATGDFEPNQNLAFFEGKEIIPLLAELPIPEEKVMGAAAGNKWIEVDLSEQKLIAWEGDKIFLESPLSSGKWFPTPTGEFSIWSKFKYTKMEGGVKGTGTYYNLPNVPYTMYFHNGFGLHGTYWHNNFGHPMSHGCVNLPTQVAEKIFYWSDPALPFGKNAVRATNDNPGTKVVVHL